jgi:predicted RND superfamily exporter protein
MSSRQRIVFWLVLLFAVFAMAYTLTDLTVKYVMADFAPPTEPKYTQWLRVEPNYGTQTDQYTPIQPAKNVFGVEDFDDYYR